MNITANSYSPTSSHFSLRYTTAMIVVKIMDFVTRQESSFPGPSASLCTCISCRIESSVSVFKFYVHQASHLLAFSELGPRWSSFRICRCISGTRSAAAGADAGCDAVASGELGREHTQSGPIHRQSIVSVSARPFTTHRGTAVYGSVAC